jgi:hypothetical protein
MKRFGWCGVRWQSEAATALSPAGRRRIYFEWRPALESGVAFRLPASRSPVAQSHELDYLLLSENFNARGTL